MSDTPRTEAQFYGREYLPAEPLVTANFARQLERELTHANTAAANWQEATIAHLKDKDQLRADVTELNERLMERQATLMEVIVALKTATQLLTRCRDSAGRVEVDLYEDLQNFLHTQPHYRY